MSEQREILEWLRDRASMLPSNPLLAKAADEIASLRAQLASIENAFLKVCEALGIQAAPLAYLDAAVIKAQLASARKALETIATALPHPDKSVLLIQFTATTKLAAETLALTDEQGKS